MVAVNKWDGLDAYDRDQIKRALEAKLKFLDFANFHYVSALKGQGLSTVFRSVDSAYKAATADLSTPRLTRALIDAVSRQSPPRSGAFRPKPRYAHQGGRNPPVIVIHGNALDRIPDSYTRYLEHTFREVFKLKGTPLRIQYNVSENPFAERKAPEPQRRGPKREEKTAAKSSGKPGGKSANPAKPVPPKVKAAKPKAGSVVKKADGRNPAARRASPAKPKGRSSGA